MKHLYLTVFMIFSAGCTFSTEPEPAILEKNIPLFKEITMGLEFTLGIGDTASVIGTDIELWLTGIQDGRCPETAYCFWQGEAIVALEINGLVQTRTDFQLSTNDPTSLDILDYRLTLVGVAPYPGSQPISEGDYEVTLIVTALFIVN